MQDSLPGAKKSSFNNLNAYRDYLVSQGADLSTIDRLMEGVDDRKCYRLLIRFKN